MARDSFQNEIPPARVNIRYVKDTGDAKEAVELPQRVLVMGDFTLREDDTEVEELDKISVNKDNFDAVMEKMAPSVQYEVPNQLTEEEDAEMQVNLQFKQMNDFRPEAVAEQVPELQALLKVRELLKDLKARVIGNKVFRKELEKILLDKELSGHLKSELDRIAPLSK
jgi:type VI secretion system protein ImpB